MVKTYIDAVKSFAATHDFDSAIDIGCGDFNVGSQICDAFKHYYATDVAASIIEQNKKNFAHTNTEFLNLSMIADSLPKADVAFVRQVLQHLSNEDIAKFLEKNASRYKVLVITETLHPSPKFIANKDVITGPGVRFHQKSGVVITEPPFSFPVARQEVICDVSVGKENIKTIAYFL